MDKSLPKGYRLRLGSDIDRARLVKFMCLTYQELFPQQQDFSHLAETVARYFSPSTPLWWAETRPELAQNQQLMTQNGQLQERTRRTSLGGKFQRQPLGYTNVRTSLNEGLQNERVLRKATPRESEAYKLGRQPSKTASALHEQNYCPLVKTVAVLWLGTAIEQVSGDRYAHIFLIFVKPEYRRQGIGTGLIQVAQEWAKKRGDRQIGLQVFTHNQPALQLYHHLGFQTQSLSMIKSL